MSHTARMSLLKEALRAGVSRHAHSNSTRRRVLVAGGAGALGGAVLEQLLASHAFEHVAVLVTQPVNVAMRGLVTINESALSDGTTAHEDTAVIVFDRERHANGRELAFLRPQPDRLPTLAAALHERGVRHLIVVMPHAAASLPEALKAGLANLDEHAVAALGFDHLIFIRSAQMSSNAKQASAAQRVADWVLSQLQLMIPQRDKPVRPMKVAQLAAQLAAHLPQSLPGTRVVPPELVWEAAQSRHVEALVIDWLSGRAPEEAAPPMMRM